MKGEEGSSIHSVAVAIYPLPPVVLLEVGAERIGDTVEQIRLKYVPSGPNRATANQPDRAVGTKEGIAPSRLLEISLS